MVERMKEMVAAGAAVAANCHPCIDHHLAKCDELELERQEVVEAIRVGLTVKRGAERAIRKHAHESFGDDLLDATS